MVLWQVSVMGLKAVASQGISAPGQPAGSQTQRAAHPCKASSSLTSLTQQSLPPAISQASSITSPSECPYTPLTYHENHSVNLPLFLRIQAYVQAPHTLRGVKMPRVCAH